MLKPQRGIETIQTDKNNNLNKKEQLVNKKQRKQKQKQKGQVFNQRKKKQSIKQDQQINLSNNEIILSKDGETVIDLSKQTNQLKKKLKKTSKAPPKIKVKNKFFADIEIKTSQQDNQCIIRDKNLLQEQISNGHSNKLSINTNKDLIFKKSTQTQETAKNLKLQNMVQKTDFIRARNDFKKLQDDKKYKSYLKKKMKQVEQVQQVIITQFQVPQIHRNKLVSSTIYLNHENFKKENNKKVQLNETPKKLTAEEIIKERKLLQNRDYFFKKLGQSIKKQRLSKNKDEEIQQKGTQTNLQNKTSSQSSKQVSSEQICQRENSNQYKNKRFGQS